MLFKIRIANLKNVMYIIHAHIKYLEVQKIILSYLVVLMLQFIMECKIFFLLGM